jgi:hypothetical protein
MRALLIALALCATLTAQALADPRPKPTTQPASTSSVRFRITNTRTGKYVEVRQDGAVSGNFCPTGRLGADGRLVLDGVVPVYRLAADGRVLEGDKEIGKFANDRTLTLAPALKLAASDDGRVDVTQTRLGTKATSKRADALLIEPADPHLYKQALFVYASGGQALLFRQVTVGGWSVVVGLAALVGYMALRVVLTDIAQYRDSRAKQPSP